MNDIFLFGGAKKDESAKVNLRVIKGRGGDKKGEVCFLLAKSNVGKSFVNEQNYRGIKIENDQKNS